MHLHFDPETSFTSAFPLRNGENRIKFETDPRVYLGVFDIALLPDSQATAVALQQPPALNLNSKVILINYDQNGAIQSPSYNQILQRNFSRETSLPRRTTLPSGVSLFCISTKLR